MSNHLAIATVTATLKDFIADVTGDVTTGRPRSMDNDASDTGTINIYLYEVLFNPNWRNADLPTRRQDSTIIQRPQTALDLHYLFSFYGEESNLIPQQLLGSTVRILHSRPVITRSMIRHTIRKEENKYLGGSDLAEQMEKIRITPIPLTMEDRYKLWSAFFQTPYALSVAYKASVVLLDSEEIPQPALPVCDRNIYVVPFNQPVIERVIAEEKGNTSVSCSASVPSNPKEQLIVAGSTILILGKRLRSEITRILINGTEEMPPIEDVTDTSIKLKLPNGLRAGVHGVQVVHPIMMGTPPVLHRSVESNVAAFVLHPTIDGPPEMTLNKDSHTISVQLNVNPKIGKEQRVVVKLNEFKQSQNKSLTPPSAYTFVVKPEHEDTDKITITFATNDVRPGQYLVRVQVDGAESLLTKDMDPNSSTYNQYSEPLVTIPEVTIQEP